MAQTVNEWLKANINKYDDRTDWINACAAVLGVRKDSVYKKCNAIWPAGKIVEKEKVDDSAVITRGDFIDRIDKVKLTLDYLDKSVGDDYILAEKLRLKLNISKAQWEAILKLPAIVERTFRYQDATNRWNVVLSSTKSVELAKTTISMSRYEQ